MKRASIKLNEFGAYRLHQIEVEWTPKWEAAYGRLQELIDSAEGRFKPFLKRGSEQVVWGVLMLVGVAIDWRAAGLIVVAAIAANFSINEQLEIRRNQYALQQLKERLYFFRELTHCLGEFPGTLEGRAPMDPGDMGRIMAIYYLRRDLDELGIDVGNPFEWIDSYKIDLNAEVLRRIREAQQDEPEYG